MKIKFQPSFFSDIFYRRTGWLKNLIPRFFNLPGGYELWLWCFWLFIPHLTVSVFFAWYDFWMGFFYDQKKDILYVCPVPCLVFKFEAKEETLQPDPPGSGCHNCGEFDECPFRDQYCSAWKSV